MEEQEKKDQKLNEKQSKFIQMKRFQFAVLLFFIVLVTAGITTSVFVFGNGKNVLKERSEFEKLYTAYDTLNKEYYKKVDPEKVVNGAINGMFDSLDDPYSDYMDKEEAASFHENISSSFEGIGAEIQELEGHIIIVSPIKGSPAEKSGLQPNDKILAVDGKSIQGMNASEAVTHIRGEKGTKVKLTIQREGVEETLNIEIVRDTIPIETVYGEMLEDGIAKVQITSFSTNTTKELLTALNDLQQEGMKGLILDLRQNPGGLLPQAIEISSLFVPDGEILFKVEDRAGNIEEYKSSNNNNSDTPLVVLIDKGSASASEILAAAVKESANVPLIGEKSFGKGTVQTAQDFDDGSNMKFTTSKWLTPKGNWIHEKGIKPDYEVSLPEYASLPYISPDKELKVSSSSNEVKTAQEMLTVLGYDPGRKDGFFDDKTKEAVIAFQKDTQLEANGVLKGESTIKLMELVRQHIEKNDTQIQKAVEVLKTLIDA